MISVCKLKLTSVIIKKLIIINSYLVAHLYIRSYNAGEKMYTCTALLSNVYGNYLLLKQSKFCHGSHGASSRIFVGNASD